MLPDILGVALQFLSRHDLDKACAVNKWFDSMTANFCEVYPLRWVREILLTPDENFTVTVVEGEGFERSFATLDEAVEFTACVLRHSLVMDITLGQPSEEVMTFTASQWTSLANGIRDGAVQYLILKGVDLSTLNNNALRSTAEFPSLEKLVIKRSILPTNFVVADLIRSSVTNGLRELWVYNNETGTTGVASDASMLDLLFPVNALPPRNLPLLWLDGSSISVTFVTKILGHLRLNPENQAAELKLFGAPRQLRSPAYRGHLATAATTRNHTTYVLPRFGEDDEVLILEIFEEPHYIDLGYRAL